MTEDHEPTLRLDTAANLSWLSRKSVSQAIISGDLVIEPVAASTIISNSSSSIDNIGCTLCGKPIFSANGPQTPTGSFFGAPPSHPTQRTGSSSRFSLKPFFSASPNQSETLASPGANPLSSSVYVFKIVASQTSDKESRYYPLCRTGWCLERLRATCDLWHFIRTGIIHVVWNGDDGYAPTAETPQSIAPTPATRHRASAGELEPPPTVIRRKSGWGLGFKLADKGSSGGWTKAFGRSQSNPGSPTVETTSLVLPVEEVKEGPANGDAEVNGEKILDAEKDGRGEQNVEAVPTTSLLPPGAEEVIIDDKPERGLGAPLELDVEKPQAVSSVPTIQQIEASPAVPLEATVEPALPIPSLESSSSLKAPPPRPRRRSSTPSLTGTDDAAPFSTPKGANLDIPDDTAAGLRVSTDLPRPEVIDLSSPNAMPTESPGTSPTRTGRLLSLAPPPVPPRSPDRKPSFSLQGDGIAGFPRSSISQQGSTVVDSPERVDVTRSEDVGAEKSVMSAGEQEANISTESGSSGAQVAKEAQPAEISSPRPPSLPPRPPLPARHPKTPTTQEQEPSSDGSKTYLTGEGWEVRTWKQVIRLKEEMWRARVGVVEG